MEPMGSRWDFYLCMVMGKFFVFWVSLVDRQRVPDTLSPFPLRLLHGSPINMNDYEIKNLSMLPSAHVRNYVYFLDVSDFASVFGYPSYHY